MNCDRQIKYLVPIDCLLSKPLLGGAKLKSNINHYYECKAVVAWIFYIKDVPMIPKMR